MGLPLWPTEDFSKNIEEKKFQFTVIYSYNILWRDNFNWKTGMSYDREGFFLNWQDPSMIERNEQYVLNYLYQLFRDESGPSVAGFRLPL